METNYLNILLLMIALIIVFVLMYAEWVAHDCKPGKVPICTHTKPAPLPTDDIETSIEKIRAMVINNYGFVSWRLSLIGAIIGTILIVYLMKGRVPNLAEYILVGLIIFFAIYFSLTWLTTNFFKPNGFYLERALDKLGEKIKGEQNNLNFSIQNGS